MLCGSALQPSAPRRAGSPGVRTWLIGAIGAFAVFIIIGLVSVHYSAVFIRWHGLAASITHGDSTFLCTPTGIEESGSGP